MQELQLKTTVLFDKESIMFDVEKCGLESFKNIKELKNFLANLSESLKLNKFTLSSSLTQRLLFITSMKFSELSSRLVKTDQINDVTSAIYLLTLICNNCNVPYGTRNMHVPIFINLAQNMLNSMYLSDRNKMNLEGSLNTFKTLGFDVYPYRMTNQAQVPTMNIQSFSRSPSQKQTENPAISYDRQKTRATHFNNNPSKRPEITVKPIFFNIRNEDDARYSLAL